MSFQAMTWAVEQKLPTNQKMVLMMLANRTNHDTGRCDPSHKRLAADCGMSLSTLKRAIAALEECGLVSVIPKRAGGVNLPNQYQLNMDQVGSERTDVGSERTDTGSQRTLPGSQRPEGVGSQRPTNQEDYNQEDNRKNERASPERRQEPYWEEFLRAWGLYPQREGGNPRKRAFLAWKARRREGVAAATLTAGLKRYASYCAAKGMTGTPYVMQGARFFGPNHEYAEPWAVNNNPDPGGVPNAQNQRRESLSERTMRQARATLAKRRADRAGSNAVDPHGAAIPPQVGERGRPDDKRGDGGV